MNEHEEDQQVIDTVSVRERVRAVLSEFVESTDLDSDGDLLIHQEGVTSCILIAEEHQRALAAYSACIAEGLAPDPFLFRWVATTAATMRFGSLVAWVRPDAMVDVYVREASIVDGLDDEGIRSSLLPVINGTVELERTARTLFAAKPRTR